MVLTTQVKKKIIKKFKVTKKDTGSIEVQIALLSSRINNLTEHFKVHKKDHHSRGGLLKLIGQRTRLLNDLEKLYSKRSKSEKYQQFIKELGIGK